jgi:hypothetical protein
MSRYPPLTDEELRALYDSNPTPECRRLLWEIDRQQELIFDLAQFLSGIYQANLEAEQLIAFSRLLAALDDEPGVRRRRAAARGNLQPPAVLGCMMFESFVGPPERWQVDARRRGESGRRTRR